MGELSLKNGIKMGGNKWFGGYTLEIRLLIALNRDANMLSKLHFQPLNQPL